jgi:hypothetical protein
MCLCFVLQAEKVFNQDLYFKRTVKYVGEPMTHLESIASSAVRILFLLSFRPFVTVYMGTFSVFNSRDMKLGFISLKIVPIYLLGAGCYQSEGFCHHLLYLIWKGRKVELEEYIACNRIVV